MTSSNPKLLPTAVKVLTVSKHPLFKMASFFLFSFPFSSSDKKGGSLTAEASFRTGESILEAAFIIALLTMRFNQNKAISFHPMDAKTAATIKLQLRNSIIASMVVCEVGPLIAHFISIKNNDNEVNELLPLDVKKSMHVLMYFFSSSLAVEALSAHNIDFPGLT